MPPARCDGARRRVAELFSEAHHSPEAVEVAGRISEDEAREATFWFAIATRDVELADSLIGSMGDVALRARCQAIRDAAVAEYD